ncbi:hypothetical protein C8D88_11472 [Lentzea atacamensis]|uniref:Uncharacterized protein n=2 Tax=Lentzea TaxID=165301 RepID=A0A316HN99_9PSEU|nr:hypothetical protein C8D88_11472 [Lentzea atacamensis]
MTKQAAFCRPPRFPFAFGSLQGMWRPETKNRALLMLAVFLPALYAFTFFSSPTEVAAAVTALALALIVVVALVPQLISQAVAPARSLSIRERAQRSAQLRLRDPDAAGRPRPRAPGCRTF